MRTPYLLALAGLMLTSTLSAQGTAGRAVFINRHRIPADTLALLEAHYRTAVPDGRYWYDPMSGAWGTEGGPALGFTAAGLPLGGALPADISGGGTGVYVNGRELHPVDLAGLQQLAGPIAPGRYWVDAQGIAGMEGGPPLVNLRALAQGQLSRSGGGVNETYRGGAAAYGNLTTGIGIITDGEGATIFNR